MRSRIASAYVGERRKGIFQLESRRGIRDLLQRMKPDAFPRHYRDERRSIARGLWKGGMVDDYIEVKHGRKEAEYPHPVMEGDSCKRRTG